MDYAQLLQHYLDLAQPYLQHYGYAALFLGVLMEGFGIPTPGQSLIMASALLAGRGEMNLTAVLLLGWMAATLGDNIGYAIGRLGGRRLVIRYGGQVGLRATQLEKVERFFARWGGAIVVIARFVDVLRQLNGVVAGTSNMPWWKFLSFNAMGAALWVGLWGGASYFLGRHMGMVLAHFKRAEAYLIGPVVAALILVGIVFWRRKIRNRNRN